MGGGSPCEHLLIILPFPRSDKQIQLLEERFPYLRITYHQLNFEKNVYKAVKEIDKGMSSIYFFLRWEDGERGDERSWG